VQAIPIYLYIDTDSPEVAKQLKAKVEAFLKSSMVEGIIRGQGIPSKGVNVMDPIPVPK